jgi:hypothetical protein
VGLGRRMHMLRIRIAIALNVILSLPPLVLMVFPSIHIQFRKIKTFLFMRLSDKWILI